MDRRVMLNSCEMWAEKAEEFADSDDLIFGADGGPEFVTYYEGKNRALVGVMVTFKGQFDALRILITVSIDGDLPKFEAIYKARFSYGWERRIGARRFECFYNGIRGWITHNSGKI